MTIFEKIRSGQPVNMFDEEYMPCIEELTRTYKALHRLNQAEPLTEEQTGAIIYPYKVREGNVFVLGDNRGVSKDSRMFGEVNLRQIKGRVVLRINRTGIERF